MMLSDYNDEGHECQGFDTFGLGVGHCVAPDEPHSRCRAPEWWGWGSTYGSRAALVPASRRAGQPALLCVTMANIATEQPPQGSDGVAMRVAARYWVVGESSATPLWSAGVALDAFSGVERNVTRDDDADDDAADAANRTAVVDEGAERVTAWLAAASNLTAALEEVA